MIPPLLVLFTWPFVVAILFASLRLPQAIVWSILGGYLLLPEKTDFNLPLIPTFDKDTVPVLCAFLGAAIGLAAKRHQELGFPMLAGWLPRSRLALPLLFLLPVMAVGTSLTNGDTLFYGETVLPGLQLYEAGSLFLMLAISLLPFILARKFLGHPDGQKVLLQALVIGGLAYSFLALYEVRMSPMLHTRIYGFFQHVWHQHERGGGYRPIVFLQHGLWLSLLLSTVTLAALALFRAEKDGLRRLLYVLAAGWLFLVLILSKSLGALAVTLLLAPIIFFLPGRIQVLAAAVVAGIVISYPALRGADLVPTDFITAQAERIDEQRAGSFRFRVINEDLLLEKSRERPVFGWGRFGRARVYSEGGSDQTVTDGYWIIRVSQSGWLGYIVEFGLLCGAILILAFRSRRIGLDPTTAAISLILAGNLLDLIPNAGLTPITWMLAGALYGRLEYGRLDETAAAAAAPAEREPTRRPAYSRFGDHATGPLAGQSAEAEPRAQGQFTRYPAAREAHRLPTQKTRKA